MKRYFFSHTYFCFCYIKGSVEYPWSKEKGAGRKFKNRTSYRIVLFTLVLSPNFTLCHISPFGGRQENRRSHWMIERNLLFYSIVHWWYRLGG